MARNQGDPVKRNPQRVSHSPPQRTQNV